MLPKSTSRYYEIQLPRSVQVCRVSNSRLQRPASATTAQNLRPEHHRHPLVSFAEASRYFSSSVEKKQLSQAAQYPLIWTSSVE
jgi:hypothetical protein